MALILCLETATTVCSVALGKDGVLLAMREVNEGYTHSENLTVFAEQVLAEAGHSFSDLDAIAVSKGPGSYTGLRIGVSAAKGFCFALDKPLIAINTLRGMGEGVLELLDLSLSLSGGEGITLGEDSQDDKDMVEESRPKYFTSSEKDWPKLINYAKQNRAAGTFAEKMMWQQLRRKQLGYKFRRQHPVGKYIPDFVCIEKRLIVEVDGMSHIGKEKKDAERTKRLEALGYTVIRFTDDEVIGELDRVVNEIRSALSKINKENGYDSRTFEEGTGNVSEPRASYILSKQQQHESLSTGEGTGEVLLCPMIDARRMEVYCAMYDVNGQETRPTAAEIITENSFEEILRDHKVLFFGDGAAKCRSKLEHQPNAVFIDSIFPSAEYLVALAEEKFRESKFEDVAYFEPYYLKDFISGGKP